MRKIGIIIAMIASTAFGANDRITNSPIDAANVILRDASGNYVDASAGGGGGGGGDFTIAAFNASLGVAGTPDSQVQSVQGISGGTPLPVSLTSVPSHNVTNAGTFAVQSTSTEAQKTGVPSNFSVATADATVFTLAAGEIGFIQNLDSADALAVKYGASASTSSFTLILPSGVAADDGNGGSVKITNWVGAVSVATMTGTARYIAWKVAP